jgi:hypothetical protein
MKILIKTIAVAIPDEDAEGKLEEIFNDVLRSELDADDIEPDVRDWATAFSDFVVKEVPSPVPYPKPIDDGLYDETTEEEWKKIINTWESDRDEWVNEAFKVAKKIIMPDWRPSDEQNT